METFFLSISIDVKHINPVMFTIPLICLWHSSQKKVAAHLLKGVSVALDWWGQCSEGCRPPLVSHCDSKHVINLWQLTCPYLYMFAHLNTLVVLSLCDRKKKSPPISSLIPMEAARLTPAFLELPEPAAPSSPKGSVKPQTSLYHHFLTEPRAAKMGISQSHPSFLWVTESLGRRTPTSFPSQTSPAMGVSEERWFPHLRQREVFPKSHTGTRQLGYLHIDSAITAKKLKNWQKSNELN